MLTDIQQLNAIISDTKKLINLAENGEWDSLVELEQTRGLAVKSLFRSKPNVPATMLAEGIEFMLAKNKILMQYSHSQRDSIHMEMSKAGHAHKAINAYISA
ncbi:MAG: flagellar protein FliT [Cycloclasticus sp.]|nr:flagellar protein FliT [Cycloclasticus sp.]